MSVSVLVLVPLSCHIITMATNTDSRDDMKKTEDLNAESSDENKKTEHLKIEISDDKDSRLENYVLSVLKFRPDDPSTL